MKKPLSVSIAICTKQRRKKLVRLLACLRRQTQPISQIVIIEDIASTQPSLTLNTLQKLFPTTNCHYHYIVNQTIGYSRNLALKYVTSDIIVFIDDDVFFDHNLLAKVVDAFTQKSNMDACVGKILPAPHTFLTHFNYCYYNDDTRWAKLPTQIDYFSFTLVGLRRKSLKNMELRFNNSLSTGEDIAFFLELAKKGGILYFWPRLVAYHTFTTNLFSTLKKFFYFARNFPYLFATYPDRYYLDIPFPSRRLHYVFFPFFLLLKITQNSLKMLYRYQLAWTYWWLVLLVQIAMFSGAYTSHLGKIKLTQGFKQLI